MVLPEGFLAYFLLKAANLSPDRQKLARATCSNLTYKDMKSNVRKVFGDFARNDGDVSTLSGVDIKTESICYADNDNDAFYSKHRGRGKGQGGYEKRRYGGGNSAKFAQKIGNNPPGWFCFRCGSPDHLIKVFKLNSSM